MIRDLLRLWRFRNFVVDRSILKKITWKRVNTFFGERIYESTVFLADGIRPNSNAYSLYSNSDGSGSGRSFSESIARALSEAVERWAFYATKPEDYIVDSKFWCDDTTGFAAFPSKDPTLASTNSRLEAIERWCILNFNFGNIPASLLEESESTQIYELHSPFDETLTVLVHYKEPTRSLSVYGFASGASLESAKYRALIEADRNLRALSNFSSQKAVTTIQEKRLVHYSQQEGTALFLEMMGRALKTSPIPKHPKIIFDGEITGPWKEYACVWRTVFEAPWDYLWSEKQNTFFF